MATGPDTVDADLVAPKSATTITSPELTDVFILQSAAGSELRLSFDNLVDVVGSAPADEYDGGAPSDTVTITLDGGAPDDAVTETVDGGSPIGVLKIANQLIKRGTSDGWAAAGDPVLPLGMFAGLIADDKIRAIKMGDGVSAWSTLEYLLAQPWTATDKTKLDGIAANADVSPAQVSPAEKTAGAETAVRAFSPADIADMAGDFGGGGGGGGDTPAQIDDTPAGERDLCTELELRSYSPADVKYIAERFGKVVPSVFGRSGSPVVAQSGDYTADQITETATRFFLSDTQKTKLDNMPEDTGVTSTGVSITLSVASHRGKRIDVTAGSVVITVPPLSGVSAFTAYDIIPIYAPNAVVTITAGSGVTIARVDGTGTSHQIKANGEAYLRKKSANNSWVLTGALV
jgi:hypothetical protein